MKTKNNQITKINNYRFPYGFSNNKYNIKLSNLLSYQNLKDRKLIEKQTKRLTSQTFNVLEDQRRLQNVRSVTDNSNPRRGQNTKRSANLPVTRILDPSISFLYREISDFMPSLLINNWGAVRIQKPSSVMNSVNENRGSIKNNKTRSVFVNGVNFSEDTSKSHSTASKILRIRSTSRTRFAPEGSFASTQPTTQTPPYALPQKAPEGGNSLRVYAKHHKFFRGFPISSSNSRSGLTSAYDSLLLTTMPLWMSEGHLAAKRPSGVGSTAPMSQHMLLRKAASRASLGLHLLRNNEKLSEGRFTQNPLRDQFFKQTMDSCTSGAFYLKIPAGPEGVPLVTQTQSVFPALVDLLRLTNDKILEVQAQSPQRGPLRRQTTQRLRTSGSVERFRTQHVAERPASVPEDASRFDYEKITGPLNGYDSYITWLNGLQTDLSKQTSSRKKRELVALYTFDGPFSDNTLRGFAFVHASEGANAERFGLQPFLLNTIRSNAPVGGLKHPRSRVAFLQAVLRQKNALRLPFSGSQKMPQGGSSPSTGVSRSSSNIPEGGFSTPFIRIRHIKTLNHYGLTPPVSKGATSRPFKNSSNRSSTGDAHHVSQHFKLRIADIPRLSNTFSSNSIRVDKEWKDQFIAKQQFKFLYGTVPQISTNLGDHASRLLSSTSRL